MPPDTLLKVALLQASYEITQITQNHLAFFLHLVYSSVIEDLIPMKPFIKIFSLPTSEKPHSSQTYFCGKKEAQASTGQSRNFKTDFSLSSFTIKSIDLNFRESLSLSGSKFTKVIAILSCSLNCCKNFTTCENALKIIRHYVNYSII